jgi:hypothetical protein
MTTNKRTPAVSAAGAREKLRREKQNGSPDITKPIRHQARCTHCQQCGKELRRIKRAGRPRAFCSNKCRDAARRDRNFECFACTRCSGRAIPRLRRRGISVLLIYHAGKGGDQRGTSRREDVLDTSISLRRPTDYVAREGARFEVHIEKGRGIQGEATKPFEARLETREGRAVDDA